MCVEPPAVKNPTWELTEFNLPFNQPSLPVIWIASINRNSSAKPLVMSQRPPSLSPSVVTLLVSLKPFMQQGQNSASLAAGCKQRAKYAAPQEFLPRLFDLQM